MTGEPKYYDKGYNGKYTESDWWSGRYKDKVINGEHTKVERNVTGEDAAGLASTGLSAAASIVAASDNNTDPQAPASIGEQTLTYAAMGASIGTSIVPGWGTAIGAVVGAAGGAINGAIEEDNYERVLAGRRAKKEEQDYLYGRGLRRAMQAKAYETYVG